ncbi:unnamed protein product [Peniophora sp. CBMAI 1063]|nr:unnamed protein product [Peniophora sp. CBMAI 1063]
MPDVSRGRQSYADTITSPTTSFEGRRGQRTTRENQFTLKHGRKHHDYPAAKAPYALSYDKDILDRDAINHSIRSVIQTNPSAAFDTGERPEQVLDLGCGAGWWVVHAASQWPETEFVGFDLVNVQVPTRYLEPSLGRRISWQHGNFLSQRLPFEAGTFDFVRCVNIGRAVPETKWTAIFQEINRVLIPGGVVEVSEEDIIFPIIPRWFTTPLRAKPRARTNSRSSSIPFSSIPDIPLPPSPPASPASNASSIDDDEPSHDHALLEMLFISLHRSRFINMKPSNAIPLYFAPFFSKCRYGPPLYFCMPFLAPLMPLPDARPATRPATSMGSELSSRRDSSFRDRSESSPSQPQPRPHSSYFPPTPIDRSTSRRSSSVATSFSEASDLFTSDGKSTPTAMSPEPSLDSDSIVRSWSYPGTSRSAATWVVAREGDQDPNMLPPAFNSIDHLSNRTRAMTLWQAYLGVRGCQEAMWEELLLLQKTAAGRKRLREVGWTPSKIDDGRDADIMGELDRKEAERRVEFEDRARFEEMLDLYESDVHARVSFWYSLTELGLPLPRREAIQRETLVEEERIRKAILEARARLPKDDSDVPCKVSISAAAGSTPKLASSSSVPAGMGRSAEGSAAAKKRQRKGEKEKGKARAAVEGGGEPGPSTVAGSSWSWTSISDPAPSRQPPVFTPDGAYFFSVLGSSLNVYSAATGAVVSTLGGHTAPITSAILSPHNAYQLITASLDGCIKLWDFLDGVLLQTFSIQQPIHFLVAHELFKDTLFVSAVRRKKAKAGAAGDDGLVLRVSLRPTPETAGLDIQKPAEVTLVGKTRLARGLAISPSGAWLVTVAGHKAYVAATASLKDGFTKFVSPEALTCLSFHPSEEYFATGDEKGTVRIWYCLSSDMTSQTVAGVEKRAPTTTLHWHAHAVSGLTFTPNGAYLLSGGEESVMVIWQLHTGKKEFVPRVGAPILNISASPARQQEYLLGLSDASFVFINSASLKVARAFSRIKLDPSISGGASVPLTPLAVHTPSQTIILPSSHPSSLQSYSPSQMKLVAELEVSPSNRVSRRDDKALQPSAVERAVVSPSGEWMATVDVREGDDSFRGEAYLKIWHWDKAAGFWELNTRVDRPHGLDAITAVSFSPEPANLLVTTGRDNNIKIWRLKSANGKRISDPERFWVLRSTFAFREECPSHASWSPDGSLLAVSLGPYVAIYDATSTMLISALTARESCVSVVSAHFLGDSGRYITAVGQREVVMWDLISRRVLWRAHTKHPITQAVSHPSEDRIAIFEQPNSTNSDAHMTHVSIFEASSSEAIKRAMLPFHLRASVWYPPSSSDHQAVSFCLVGVSDKYRVVLFGDEVLHVTDPGTSAHGLGGESASRPTSTLFQDIFGKTAFAGVSTGPSNAYGVAQNKIDNVADLLDVPAYLLPSVDTIFDSIMGSFLLPRAAEEHASPEQPAEIPGDIPMEVEEPVSARDFVEDEEIGMLIHFFRDVAVKGPYDPMAPLPLKGSAHFGAPPSAKRKKDRHHSKPRPPPTPPQDSYPSPESTPSLTAVPPATAGKKRRKSQAS